jgi:hypothetical protein
LRFLLCFAFAFLPRRTYGTPGQLNVVGQATAIADRAAA